MRHLTVLRREGTTLDVELSSDAPYVYALGERLRFEGYGMFHVESAYSTGDSTRRQQRLELTPWEGDEKLPAPGEVVAYEQISPERPTCCPTGLYYQWNMRGYPLGTSRWVGPEDHGWCSHAGTTGGGRIWNITHCESCGAPMPATVPEYERPKVRRWLLGLLKLKAEAS